MGGWSGCEVSKCGHRRGMMGGSLLPDPFESLGDDCCGYLLEMLSVDSRGSKVDFGKGKTMARSLRG